MTIQQPALEPATEAYPSCSSLGPDGYLAAPDDWSTVVAEEVAEVFELGPLTLEHWRTIEFTRAYYLEHGLGPAAVRIARATGFSSKKIWDLFPDGIIRGVYRLAGLPKPYVCFCECF
jgi:dissimilatory sulfite reductase related protein